MARKYAPYTKPTYRQELPWKEARKPKDGQLLTTTSGNIVSKIQQNGYLTVISGVFTAGSIATVSSTPLTAYRNLTSAYLAIYLMGIACFTTVLAILFIQVFNILILSFKGRLLWMNSGNNPDNYAQDLRNDLGFAKGTGKTAGTEYGWSSDVEGMCLNDNGYRMSYNLPEGWQKDQDFYAKYPNGTIEKGYGPEGKDVLTSLTAGDMWWSIAQEFTEESASMCFIRKCRFYQMVAWYTIIVGLFAISVGELIVLDGFMYHQNLDFAIWPLFVVLGVACLLCLFAVKDMHHIFLELIHKSDMTDYFDQCELTPNGYGFAGMRYRESGEQSRPRAKFSGTQSSFI